METYLGAVEAQNGANWSKLEAQSRTMEAHLRAMELIPEPHRLFLALLWLN